MVLWHAPRSWTDREIVTGAHLTQQIQHNLMASLWGITQAAWDLGVAIGPNELARVALGLEGATFRADDEGAGAAWWTPTTWTPIYGPSTDADQSHGFVRMFSGALVRARRGPLGELYVQKITDPTVLSQWTTWTELKPAATVFATAGIALASGSTEDRLRLFWVLQSDSRTIKCAESTDGTTWVEETVYVEASPGFIVALGADMTGGDNHLIYVFDGAASALDQFLTAIERVAGVWTNRTVRAAALHPTSGIGVARDPATNTVYVCVAGSTTAAPVLESILVAEFDRSANTWTTLTTLYTAPAGTTVRNPRLRHADADYNRHAYSWVEETAGPVYAPVLKLADPPARFFITESVSWGAIRAEHGLALVRTPTHWYLAGARRAFRALLSLGPEEPLVEDFSYPWYVPIDPIDPATGHANWDTRAAVNGPYTSLRESSGAQNAEVFWDVALGAGDWTLGLVFKKAPDAGIITPRLITPAGYRQTALNDAPAAYWRLGESSGTSAADASGNGRTVTLTGGVTLGQAGGIAPEPDGTRDTAALFDGASGFGTSTSFTAFAGAVTLEAWVNPNVATTPTIVTILRGPDGTSPRIERTAAGLALFLWLTSAGPSDSLTSTSLPQNTWSHIVGTHDGTTARLYVNGVQVASKASTLKAGIAGTWVLGRLFTGDLRYWPGRIDEVKIHPVALSAVRVLAHYEAGLDQANSDEGAVTPGTPATVDGYNAATLLGQTASVAFAVGTPGVKRLKLAMLTKHASSSSYKGYVHHLTLMRTA